MKKGKGRLNARWRRREGPRKKRKYGIGLSERSSSSRRSSLCAGKEGVFERGVSVSHELIDGSEASLISHDSMTESPPQ